MTVTYELKAHSRNVNMDLNPGKPGETPIGKHTGYDLITYVDGVPTRIESIDLYKDNGNINFDIRSQLVNRELYETTGEVFGTYMWYDNKEELVSSYFLMGLEYQTTPALATEADAAKKFYKIKLEATILKQLGNNLDYDFDDRNCNTSTNYFGQEYLGINDVCSMFLTGSYIGSGYPFYDPNSTSTTDVTIKAVRNIIDKYYSLVGTNVDLSNVQYGVVNQSNAWYAKFTTDDYNYVFAGNGEANIVDLYGDSFIYADAGNHTINAGNGNDVIYGREANVIDGGDGNDIIYAGDQTYAAHSIGAGAGDDYIYAGHGGDEVRGGNGNNTVYLGSGSDKYTGGDDVDIVDGGSRDFIFTDSADNSFKYTLSADLSGDINEINLGGGNDEYSGGIGKDKVDGGSGDNTIRTDAGNDEVKMSGSTSSDLNWVYLGKGSDSFDKVDLYVEAIRKIMADEKRRMQKVREVAAYVCEVHNVSRFVEDLREVIKKSLRRELAGGNERRGYSPLCFCNFLMMMLRLRRLKRSMYNMPSRWSVSCWRITARYSSASSVCSLPS